MYWTSVVAASLVAPAHGQTLSCSLIERGPHHKVWVRAAAATNHLGAIHYQTNSYTELQTGTSVLDPNTGQWRDSSPDFEITPDGHAVAAHCPHQVIVAPSLLAPEGIVDLLTPGGAVRLRSAVLGLSLFDPVSGKSLQIASARECAGRQTAPNAITFFDAFDGLKADVRLRNEVGQFHQEVLLNEKLTPEQLERLGFDARTARLEVWTEFLAVPSPSVRSVLLQTETNAALRATMAEPDTVDQLLGWGTMRMTRGKTFVEAQAGRSAVVFKEWMQSGGRSFLVEAATYASLQPLLDALPATGTAALKPKQPATRLLAERAPPQRVQPRENRAVQIARLGAAGTKPTGPQVVLDYVLLDSTQTNLALQADTTYYIAGTVATDRLTVEGGTVVKYTNTPQATIVADEVVCRTASYRPATFTSKDLDSIGERINGSTGNPADSYYGSIALDLTAAASAVVSNVHFSYLSNALAGTGIVLRDAQIMDCYAGFAPPHSEPVLRNILLYRVGTLIAADPEEYGGDELTAEHVTAHYCTNLMADPTSYTRLTNCLFACVSNWQCAGAYTNASVFLDSDAGVFQTVGAASHYLAPDSPYRNAGTTNISSSLLAELRERTTYPPMVYSNVIISADTTLGPQAQRDTDPPDLGYHYDPLDYTFKCLWLSNVTFQLLPGTAAATFGAYGLAAHCGSQLVSEGTPTRPNHIVRYNLVQEGSRTNWDGNGSSVLGSWVSWPSPSQVHFRFTDWAMPAQDGAHFQTYSYDVDQCFTDCEFHGGALVIFVPRPYFTNCLLERVNVLLDDFSVDTDVSPVVRNCLFSGGTLDIWHYRADTWLFRDNLFDLTAIITNMYETAFDAAYNGYTPGSDRLMPTNATDVVASIDWQTGPLGNYYQPTNSAFLTNGSIAANLVGLYHYTVLTNQVKATTNMVSRGYHYVAVDASTGQPYDYDEDGFPDYLEDANGDGDFGGGDLSDWRTYDSQHGLSPGNGLQVFTPLK